MCVLDLCLKKCIEYLAHYFRIRAFGVVRKLTFKHFGRYVCCGKAHTIRETLLFLRGETLHCHIASITPVHDLIVPLGIPCYKAHQTTDRSVRQWMEGSHATAYTPDFVSDHPDQHRG